MAMGRIILFRNIYYHIIIDTYVIKVDEFFFFTIINRHLNIYYFVYINTCKNE